MQYSAHSSPNQLGMYQNLVRSLNMPTNTESSMILYPYRWGSYMRRNM